MKEIDDRTRVAGALHGLIERMKDEGIPESYIFYMIFCTCGLFIKRYQGVEILNKYIADIKSKE